MPESAAEAAEPTTCPACAAPADPARRWCRRCREDFTPLFAERWARELEEATRRDIAEGTFPPPARFRRIRLLTWALLALVAAGAHGFAVFVADSAGPHIDMRFPVAVLGGGVFLWVAVPFVLFLSRDLAARPAREFGDPAAVLRTAAVCLLAGRWEDAGAFLLPRGRTRERRRPAIPALAVDPTVTAMGTTASIRDYWAPVVRPGGGQLRRGRIVDIVVEPDGEGRAIGRCELAVTAAPAWLSASLLFGVLAPLPFLLGWLCLARRRTLTIETRLLRVGERWYLHDAALVGALQE
jgi:3D (Asp-Asp-Asp) domain-containing protein